MPVIIMRYIGTEMAKAFSLTLAVVTVLWVFFFTLQLMRHNVVGPTQFVAVVPLLTVVSLSYSLPIAVLFGVSFAYGRMSADNEIRALGWHGVHAGWIIMPAGVVAVAATVLSVYINAAAVPAALRAREKIIAESIVDVLARQLAEAAQLGESIQFDRITLKLDAWDDRTSTLTGVTIIQADEKLRPVRSITADSARVLEGKVPGAIEYYREEKKPEEQHRYISFIFHNGRIQEFDPESRMRVRVIAAAPPITIDVSKDTTRVALKELPLAQLAEFEKTAKKPSEKNKARTLLYERLALGMSPLFFALVAAPMAMVARWKHTLTSFLPSLAVAVTVYYPLVMWAKIQGEAGSLNPLYGMFAGNAVMLVLGLALTAIILRR